MRNGEDRAIVMGNRVFFRENDVGDGKTTIFYDVEVGGVNMVSQDHVAGAIYNSVIGISCNTVNKLRDGFISPFCCVCLLDTNLAECNKEIVV